MRTLLVLGLAGWLVSPTGPGALGQTLNDLSRTQHFTAHRVSSADPSGGNLDMRRINAGQTLTLAELEGPGEITHIWFTYMYPSRSALRKLVLRVWFDDIAEPCVEAPLGDFFGLGHALSYAYASMPLAVGTSSGLNCYWRMPFTKHAKLTLTNDGVQDCAALYYQIDYRKLDAVPADGLHFFAAYRQAFPCVKEQPYLILQTDGGAGHYAGCNLSIEQQDESWWGEGDMRVYVDGEKKPSIAGTGSEDDFGGAWCYSHEFSYPQFGAPLRGRFNAKGILERCVTLRDTEIDQWKWPQAWKPGDLWNVYRYHVSDAVPFRKSILVNIEHGWQNNERSDWYSSVAYWYQTGKPSTRPTLPPAAERMPAYLRPHDHTAHKDRQDAGHTQAARWEAEDLADTAKASAGAVLEAGMHFWGEMFSQQYGLQWDAAAPGDRLKLPFKIEWPGRYQIVARLCRNGEGGRFGVSIDDGRAGEPVELFQPPPFPGPFDHVVAEAELQVGEHVLTFDCAGRDEKSKGHRLMIDWFQVRPSSTTKPVP